MMKKILSGVLMVVGLSVLALPAMAGSTNVQYKVWEGKLNINDASAAELVMLEGIGKATAHRIVEYREKAGGFKSLSQLKDVRDVGDGKFANIEANLSLFEKSDLRVLVDINMAPLSALEALPGVSKKLAVKMLEYRDRNEGFKVTEDILKIDGVGLTKLKELQHFVTVRPLKTAPKEVP